LRVARHCGARGAESSGSINPQQEATMKKQPPGKQPPEPTEPSDEGREAIQQFLDQPAAPPPTAEQMQGWFVLTAHGTDIVTPTGPKPIREVER
jgi:hypothetical protein